ncbi:hypothetical protein A3A21_03700 [Candidatus Jorgensenbacteria bacterium RIFCSPLOWO2_01_FULL_45_25b]|uniref:PIN domain-containing protein n=1 Tax=Candidatus Jorgensenbacteria bacterium RIFCSPLOWO2_01_FULL_45_25b TaxID=1798471 RepID=A0A1F6BWF2_9BACT|nr:MAG: hypothetical protein A3A21_03700 [Candidatus Jorgensenbacteria bacterium RIFCSPLOWO2_01_FULL_45_25b]HLD33963.1 hypothetical protein [Candidatus Nanoarchaeia archaeon]
MFVSNSSTLILLAKITLLQKFLDNAPKVIIPEEVRNEISIGSFDAQLIESEIIKGRISVVNSDSTLKRELMEQFRLDVGEAAAFTLYKPIHHAILTDDRELIKLCKIQRIPFICAMAIVVRLNEQKIISKQQALEKIDRLFEIGRYSKEIYEIYKKEVK